MLFSPFVLSCLYSLVAFGPLTSAQTILTTGPLATATPNLTSTTGATSLLATTTGVQLSSATSASVYTSAPSSRGESSPVLLSRYLQQSDVRVQNGYTVIEIPGTIEDPAYAALCWYPVSGNYGYLLRVLYYVTLVFALVARVHPWLIAGALAYALTYAGSAAVHACLLVWRGPGYGELDIFPLLAILSSACLLAVPLLNWSSTIRNLGTRIEGLADDGQSSTRTILVWWSFIVTVGFFCVFFSLRNGPATLDLLFIRVAANEVFCSPSQGILNTTAGQGEEWKYFIFTHEFITENNCVSPCASLSHPKTIFRDNKDIELMTRDEVNIWFNGDLGTNEKYVVLFVRWGLFSISYVILQGVWAVCFNRRSPAQVRDLLYLFSSRIEVFGRQTEIQKWCAKWISVMLYLWAILILIICPPLFVMDLIAAELLISYVPHSESSSHVGAWSPWVSTALVLFAAFITRFGSGIMDMLKRGCVGMGLLLVGIWSRKKQSDHAGGANRSKDVEKGQEKGTMDLQLPQSSGSFGWKGALAASFAVFPTEVQHLAHRLTGAFHTVSDEWKNFIRFCKNPDEVAHQTRQRSYKGDGVDALVRGIHGEKFRFDATGRPAPFDILAGDEEIREGHPTVENQNLPVEIHVAHDSHASPAIQDQPVVAIHQPRTSRERIDSVLLQDTDKEIELLVDAPRISKTSRGSQHGRPAPAKFVLRQASARVVTSPEFGEIRQPTTAPPFKAPQRHRSAPLNSLAFGRKEAPLPPVPASSNSSQSNVFRPGPVHTKPQSPKLNPPADAEYRSLRAATHHAQRDLDPHHHRDATDSPLPTAPLSHQAPLSYPLSPRSKYNPYPATFPYPPPASHVSPAISPVSTIYNHYSYANPLPGEPLSPISSLSRRSTTGTERRRRTHRRAVSDQLSLRRPLSDETSIRVPSPLLSETELEELLAAGRSAGDADGRVRRIGRESLEDSDRQRSSRGGKAGVPLVVPRAGAEARAEGVASSSRAGPQPVYRSTMSYLQVARPATVAFRDEIRLRKGRDGVYYFVEDGEAEAGGRCE